MTRRFLIASLGVLVGGIEVKYYINSKKHIDKIVDDISCVHIDLANFLLIKKLLIRKPHTIIDGERHDKIVPVLSVWI